MEKARTRGGIKEDCEYDQEDAGADDGNLSAAWLRCVRRTLRHEIGHALGLAMDPKRTNTEKHFGVHCTAPGCSMRQAENLLKLLRFSREEEQQGKWFCPDCLADLEKALSKAGKQE